MNFNGLYLARKFAINFAGLFALCIALFSANTSQAQIDTEFWFAAPYASVTHGFSQDDVNYAGGYGYLVGGNKPLYLKLSTLSAPARVTISIPASLGRFKDIVKDIPANQTVAVDLTEFEEYFVPVPEGGIAENKGIHIVSTELITAYYEVATIKNPDLFALKGLNALGTEFYTPFQNVWANQDTDCWGNDYSSQAFSAIDIVATEDMTRVWIKSPVDLTGGIKAGVEKEIILHLGQTFSARAVGQAPEDHPIGAYIHSDKPIAVTIKDDSAVLNISRDDGEDLMGDQLIPVSLVGTEYIVMQGNITEELDERFFIVATQPNTTVTIDGDQYSLPEAGSHMSYIIRDASTAPYVRVLSDEDKPIYVFHISGYDQEMAGAVLPPINACTGSDRIGFTRTYGEYYYEKFFMNILVKKGAEGAFLLDGQTHPSITASAFTSVGESQWMAARIEFTKDPRMDVGQHLLENTENFFHMAFVNTTVYEWKDKGTWDKEESEIIWGGDDDWEIQVCNGDTTYLADQLNFTPRLIGAIYGYFSNFDISEPEALVINTMTDSAIFPLVHDEIKLRASGGYNYVWKGQQKVDGKWVDMQSPYYLSSTKGSEVAVGEDIPEGEYLFTVSMESRCFVEGEASTYIKIVDVPAPGDIYDCLCDFPKGSGTSSFYNLYNLADTILREEGIAAGSKITGWYYSIEGDTLMIEDYDDSRLVTDITSGYSSDQTNVDYSVVSNPAEEGNNSSKVGHIKKVAENISNSVIDNDGKQAVVEFELPEQIEPTFASPVFVKLLARYDEGHLEDWQLNSSSFYIKVALVNSSGSVVAEDEKPIATYLISDPNWADFVFSFVPDGSQTEFSRLRITFGMDFFSSTVGIYVDNIEFGYDSFNKEVKDPTSVELFDGDSILAKVVNNDLVQYGSATFGIGSGCKPIDLDLGIFCSDKEDGSKDFDIEQYDFYDMEGSLIAYKIWYHDPELTALVDDPSKVSVTGKKTFYAHYQDRCETNVGTVTVEVVPEPDINPDATAVLCGEPLTDGKSLDCVDLTDFESEVCSNTTDNALFEWFKNSDYTGAIQDPSCVSVEDDGVIYVKVSNRSEDGTYSCVQQGELAIDITPAPVPNVPEIDDMCADAEDVVLESYASNSGVFYIDDVPRDELVPSEYTDGKVVSVRFETVIDGCDAVHVQDVEIFEVPDVRIEDIGTVNYGDIAELDATVTGGATGTYEYSWTPANLLQDPNAQDPKTEYLFNTAKLSLSVVDENECANSADLTINVKGVPVKVKIGVSDSVICLGETVYLEPIITGGTGDFSYSWTSNPNIIASSDEKISIKPTEETVVILSVYDNKDNMSAEASVSITVNKLPEIELSSDLQYTCEDVEGQVEAEVTGGNTPYTYLWEGSTYVLDSSDILEPKIDGSVFDPANDEENTHLLELTVTDANGCVANKPLTIEVYENPKIDVVAELPLCQGLQIPLHANVSGGTQPYTHKWTDVEGLSATDEEEPVYNAVDYGDVLLGYAVTDANGCEASMDLPLTILEKPEVSLNDTVYCHNVDGISALLESGTLTPEASYVYKWYKGFQLIGEDKSLVVDLSEADEYDVSYIVEYDTEDPARKCRDTAFASIIIRETPVAQVSAERGVCQNDTLELIGTHDSGYDYTYSWKGVGAEYLSETDNHTVEFHNPVFGTYDLTYTQTRVYDEISCPSSEKITVQVKDTTVIDLDDQDVCAGESLAIDAGVSGSGVVDVTWYKNDEPLSVDDVQNPIFKFPYEDEFRLGMRVKDNNGCTSYNEVDVSVWENPDAKAGFDLRVAYDTKFELDGSASSSKYFDTLKVYEWTSDEFLTDANTATPTGRMKESDDLVLYVEDDHGCFDRDTVQINVFGGPLGLRIKDDEICHEYEAAYLDALATGGEGEGSYTYEWFALPDTVTIVSTEKIYRPQPHEDAEYKCIVYSGEILPDTAYAQVVTHTRPDSKLLSKKQDMCFGTSQVLTVVSENIQSYLWAENGEPISLEGTDQYSFSANKKGRYIMSVLLTDENSCRDTLVDTIRVHENPTVDIEIEDPDFCVNEERLIKAYAEGGSGAPYEYFWNNHPKLKETGDGPQAMIYASDEDAFQDPVSVNITDGNGCKASATAFVDIFPLPTVPDPKAFSCSDKDVTVKLQNSLLDFSITDYNGYEDYFSSGSNEYIFNAPESGTYTLPYTATDGRGCKKKSELEVTVYKGPEIELPECQICAGGRDVITVSSPTIVNYWYWDKDYDGEFDVDGGTLSKTSELNYQTYSPGKYNVGVQAVKIYGDVELRCYADSVITVKVLELPSVSITGKKEVPYGGRAMLKAELIKATTSEYIDDYSIEWSLDANIQTGNGTQSITSNELTLNSSFSVAITDANTCVGRDRFLVVLEDRDTLYIAGLDTVCQFDATAYIIENNLADGRFVEWTLINEKRDTVIQSHLPKFNMTWDEYGDYVLYVNEVENRYPAVFDSIVIHVIKKPVVDILPDVKLCLGDKGRYQWLEDTVAMSDSTFSWSIDRYNADSSKYFYSYSSYEDSLGEFIYQWDTVGDFQVQLYMTNEKYFCANSHSVDVVVNPLPDPSYIYKPTEKLYTDTWIDFVNTTFESVAVNDNILFYWDFIGDEIYVEDEFNSTYIYDEPGEYEANLLAIDTVTGCRAVYVDTVTIVPNPDCRLLFPNAFTPERTIDNKFKWGYMKSVVEKEYTLRIYNRWGDLIWQTDDRDDAWDGKSFDDDCKQDVYVYQCEATCEDGAVLHINGDVTLIK